MKNTMYWLCLSYQCKVREIILRLKISCWALMRCDLVHLFWLVTLQWSIATMPLPVYVTMLHTISGKKICWKQKHTQCSLNIVQLFIICTSFLTKLHFFKFLGFRPRKTQGSTSVIRCIVTLELLICCFDFSSSPTCSYLLCRV